MSFDNFESNYIEIDSGSGGEKETDEAAIKEVGERLKKGEWLWHPYMVDKIKTLSEGRNVVVVDVDGVLRSSRTSEDDENPGAEKVLKELKEKGYLVVIWTSSSREWLEDKSQKFVDMVDFAISDENYNDMFVFREYKRQLRELIEDFDGYSQEQRANYLRDLRPRKRFELLFDNAVLLEDGAFPDRFARSSDVDGHEVVTNINGRAEGHYSAQINLANFSGDVSEKDSKMVLGEWVVGAVDKLFQKNDSD